MSLASITRTPEVLLGKRRTISCGVGSSKASSLAPREAPCHRLVSRSSCCAAAYSFGTREREGCEKERYRQRVETKKPGKECGCQKSDNHELHAVLG